MAVKVDNSVGSVIRGGWGVDDSVESDADGRFAKCCNLCGREGKVPPKYHVKMGEALQGSRGITGIPALRDTAEEPRYEGGTIEVCDLMLGVSHKCY